MSGWVDGRVNDVELAYIGQAAQQITGEEHQCDPF